MINWDGGTKRQSTAIGSMLEYEKYKGDTLLQKSYKVDFFDEEVGTECGRKPAVLY